MRDVGGLGGTDELDSRGLRSRGSANSRMDNNRRSFVIECRSGNSVMAALLNSLTVVREGEMGTLGQRPSTPVRAGEIALGTIAGLFCSGLPGYHRRGPGGSLRLRGAVLGQYSDVGLEHHDLSPGSFLPGYLGFKRRRDAVVLVPTGNNRHLAALIKETPSGVLGGGAQGEAAAGLSVARILLTAGLRSGGRALVPAQAGLL